VNYPKIVYKYRVEYMKEGKWTAAVETDLEDIRTFELVANAEEYQYRVLCHGEDVTHLYKKQRLPS